MDSVSECSCVCFVRVVIHIKFANKYTTTASLHSRKLQSRKVSPFDTCSRCFLLRIIARIITGIHSTHIGIFNLYAFLHIKYEFARDYGIRTLITFKHKQNNQHTTTSALNGAASMHKCARLLNRHVKKQLSTI